MSKRKYDSDVGRYVTGEWTVRNKITFIDPSIPTLDIYGLQAGEMFQYVDKVGDGAYMKLSIGDGKGAVYLPTGMYYQILEGKALRRVTALQINSPIS